MISLPATTFADFAPATGFSFALITILVLLGVLIIREMSAPLQHPLIQRLKRATLIVILPFSIVFLITLALQVGNVP